MAYKVIILYQLYMPSYFLGTFTEYPFLIPHFPLYVLLKLWIRKDGQNRGKDNRTNEKAVHRFRQVIQNNKQPFLNVCSQYKIKKNSFKNKVKI